MRARGVAAVAVSVQLAACGRSQPGSGGPPETLVVAPTAPAPGAPRRGMVWIPPGVLHAGSRPDDVPRVADVEMPGTDLPMDGFYIDLWPWPNEPGAIPTTSVSRDEARRLCEGVGKRLCSELEWERACKGPDATRYEYGPAYEEPKCGASTGPEFAARRPSGERPACRSGFGVHDLHGGVAQWTDSRWGRGGPQGMGAVRGGSDLEPELTSRCAFGRALAPDQRSPVTGFRCCAGSRNEVEVELEVKRGPVFERTAHPARPFPSLDALGGAACGPQASPAPCSMSQAWTWRPVPNSELLVAGGCIGTGASARCALGVARSTEDGGATVAQVDMGSQIPEFGMIDPAERRVRMRGGNVRGHFYKDLVFSYGRVDVKDVR